MTPAFGWYADDFTGATDTLAVAARSGLRSILFLSLPEPTRLGRVGALDAIGIAGSARTMNPQAMQAFLPEVGRFFASLGVAVLHYKCCSTFDSAPESGNLAVAMRILGNYVPGAATVVVGGQPDIGRYCCFGNLFAAAGDRQIYRLDRHPTMHCHPVTPMNEADIGRHLRRLGIANIVNVPYTCYCAPAIQLDHVVDAHGQACDSVEPPGQSVLLFDVAEEAHLPIVGRQVARLGGAPGRGILAVGSSAVLQAMAAYWKTTGTIAADHRSPSGARAFATRELREDAPVFVFAGSMSPVTADQVTGARGYLKIPLQADRLLHEAGYAARCCERVVGMLGQGRHVLAHIEQERVFGSIPADAHSRGSGPSASGHGGSAEPGLDGARRLAIRPAQLAIATAEFVRAVVGLCRQRNIALRRLGIAGGDTSSHATQRLDIWALSYVDTLAPGVTLCRAHSDDPMLDGLELMLKGGQMGGARIFDRLLQHEAAIA